MGMESKHPARVKFHRKCFHPSSGICLIAVRDLQRIGRRPAATHNPTHRIVDIDNGAW
jgi:hypothetical protein